MAEEPVENIYETYKSITVYRIEDTTLGNFSFNATVGNIPVVGNTIADIHRAITFQLLKQRKR